MKRTRTSKVTGWSFSNLSIWCCLLACWIAPGKASAGSIYAAGNGDWTNGTTWVGTIVPGSGDTAIITNNYAVTLTNQENITSALNIGTTTYDHKGGTLVISNATLSTTLDSYVGKATTGARGVLLIAGGGTFNQGGSSKIFYIQGTGTDPWTGSKVTVDNGTLSLSYHLNVNGVGGVLVVTNGGLVNQTVGDFALSATNNLIFIGGTNAAGSPARAVASRRIDIYQKANGIIVDQGGSFSNDNASYGLTLGGYAATPANGIGSSGNFLIVTNGGFALFRLTPYVGFCGASNNYVHVGGAGVDGKPSTIMMGNNLYVGGSYSNNVGNYVWVGQGGQMTNIATLYVGGSATGTNTSNYVSLASGGLMEIKTGITIGNATEVGNYVMNNGGILQFTAANPSAITINNRNSDLALGNAVIINGGTLAFRGITSGALPNLTNNLAASGTGIGTNNIYWQGVNTFRLDSCNATNTVAGGYTFANTGNAWDYAGLELVNGASAIRGQAVTIGSGGSLLVSNITSGAAMFQGPLTNNSAKMILASVNSLVASNGIVWLNNSAATTTAKTVTFDAYTTNQLAGTVTWHQAATATQVVGGVVNGSGPLQKTGPGVLVLAGTNAYAGGTTVNNGMLNLSGISTGSVSVASGGTILVSGTLTGAVTVASGGVLSGAGKVVGAVTNAGALVATINADGTATGPVVSNLVLQAGAYLSLLGTNYLTAPTNYTVVTYTGTRSGQFDPSLSNVPKGWRLSYGQAGKIVVMAGYPGTVLLFQ